jgi:uncharacterized protein with GYD domain
MNTYVILLRRMDGAARSVSLARPVISEIAESNGVLLLDVLTLAGIFDAAVTCRAPNNDAVRLLLEGLDGWHTEALLATGHIRFQEGS